MLPFIFCQSTNCFSSQSFFPAPALRSAYQQVVFNRASRHQSESISGIESPTTAPSDKEPPRWTAVKKERVTVCQNHNKPLLRQSLTGCPSGQLCNKFRQRNCGTTAHHLLSQFHLIHHTIFTVLQQKCCVIYKHDVARWLILCHVLRHMMAIIFQTFPALPRLGLRCLNEQSNVFKQRFE